MMGTPFEEERLKKKKKRKQKRKKEKKDICNTPARIEGTI